MGEMRDVYPHVRKGAFVLSDVQDTKRRKTTKLFEEDCVDLVFETRGFGCFEISAFHIVIFSFKGG